MDDPFRWLTIKNKDELLSFYLSIIPKIREAAKAEGYAIGIHGSLQRDLDLIAIPWTENYSDKEKLVRVIQRAACGIEMQSYQWEEKPHGRSATCFPVCFPEWNEPSLGHIDLSVITASGALGEGEFHGRPSVPRSNCQNSLRKAAKDAFEIHDACPESVRLAEKLKGEKNG